MVVDYLFTKYQEYNVKHYTMLNIILKELKQK
jgi:hypothetical protein